MAVRSPSSTAVGIVTVDTMVVTGCFVDTTQVFSWPRRVALVGIVAVVFVSRVVVFMLVHPVMDLIVVVSRGVFALVDLVVGLVRWLGIVGVVVSRRVVFALVDLVMDLVRWFSLRRIWRGDSWLNALLISCL